MRYFALYTKNVKGSGKMNSFYINGKYIKNKIPLNNIIDDYIISYGFSVYNSIIFEVGSFYNTACYWVDGKLVKLNGSHACTIFITD